MTNSIKDDGDIIKACGFLAIYSGNLEDELDQLYQQAKLFCPELTGQEQYRFADKARHLRKTLIRRFKISQDYSHKAAEEPRVRSVLGACKKIADDRNRILHSSIYSDAAGVTMLKNRIHGTRRITSKEVYDLANDTWSMHGAIYGLRFAVSRLQMALEKSRGKGVARPITKTRNNANT